MVNNSYRLFRIYGYPGFGLVFYLILVLINPYDQTFKTWHLYTLRDHILEFSFCVFYAVLLFETGIQLTAILNKWVPWERHTKRRFGIQMLIHISIIYVIINVFFRLSFLAYFRYDATLSRQILIIAIIFSLLITTLFAAEFFFYRWNDDRMKSLEIEQHSIQNQLDALKLQLDPHFLFNNLSIVTALVEDEPNIAISYISKLSSIYRYMITNRAHNLVPLKEELDFIRSYLYLYQIRYGNSIRVHIEEMPEAAFSTMPPLILHLLIENAIGHNVFSIEFPLTIQILFPEGRHSLVVENNKMPGFYKEERVNMGLKNIQERYRLLKAPPPVILNTESCFRVEVALMD